MKKSYVLLALLIASAAGLGANHGGGLDKNGCHNNKKDGTYHCHQGPLKGRSFASKAEAEKEHEKAKQKPATKEQSLSQKSRFLGPTKRQPSE